MRKFQVTVNGNTYEVDVEELTGSHRSGSKPSVAVQPTINETKKASSGSGPVSLNVEAPMHGKIVDIKVSEGGNVEAGDVIVILEAMKMENEVVAPSKGTIVSINVATGQSVNAGDIILTMS
jgi:biotin carboxyl carrier protein